MQNQKMETKEARQMNDSLEPLKIHQLEERLEVSCVMPGGDVVDGNFFDGENCCHDKCSGNDISIDDPLDTGEILLGGPKV